MEEQIHSMLFWLIPIIAVLAIRDSVWKLIAMWRAVRNNHQIRIQGLSSTPDTNPARTIVFRC